jgi:anti-anti-sigma regulatory factor
MALFQKPPAKKPDPPTPGSKPVPGAAVARPQSARELAAQAQGRDRGPPQMEPALGDITVTGASLIDWKPVSSQIEVAQANPGLCAVLENAALLYAGGQAKPARQLLEQGVQTDHDTRLSPLAWLALFDLLQRAGDRAGFDQLALQYVVQFERSAPPWEESTKRAEGPKATAGGYIVISGKLSGASPTQVDGLRRAIAKNVPLARLDLAAVTGFDDAGAKHLADALAEARRCKFGLVIQRSEKLRTALDAMVKKGRDGGEGAWLLSLELLQWQRDQSVFDDRAVEFAVAFELSPPSWEPPPPPPATPAENAAATAAAEAAEPAAAAAEARESLRWSGVMVGSANPQLAQLSEFALRRAVIPIDLSAVERIDFVCAGALLNTVNRIEQQRKAVQIGGASPIVRALLLLIGISPRHFVKR